MQYCPVTFERYIRIIPKEKMKGICMFDIDDSYIAPISVVYKFFVLTLMTALH